MTKHIYQQSVFESDDAVRIAPFASISVTLAGGDPCVIWSDAAGSEVIADSEFLADEFGFFSFYADPGKYDISILSGDVTKVLHDVEIARTGITDYWDMTPPVPTCAAPLSGDGAALIGLQPFPTITGQSVSASGGASYLASTNYLAPYPAFSDVRAFEIHVTRMDSGALVSTGVICSTDVSKSVLVAYLPTYHGGVWLFQINSVTIAEYLGTGLERAGIKIDGASGDCWFYIDGVQRGTGSGADTTDVVLAIAWNGSSSSGTDVFSGQIITDFAALAHDYGCLDWCGNASAGGDAVLPTAARDGDIYEVSVAGTYQGVSFSVGDLAVVRIDGTSVTRIGAGPTGPQGPQGDPGPAGADGASGADGATGSAGIDGWTPIFAVVTDGSRRVLQVSDWTGGSGTKPTTGKYVGAGGLVTAIADGVDIRGAAGATGETGATGAAAIGPVGSSTWASRPAASLYNGLIWLMTDIGSGAFCISNGTRWRLMHRVKIYAGTGDVVVTNDTNWTAVASITIPGGLLGPTGSAVFYPLWSMTISANGKSFRVRFGGNDLVSIGPGFTSAAQNSGVYTITNTATNAQVSTGAASIGMSTSGGAVTMAAVNTESDVAVSVDFKMAALSETMTLKRFYVEIVP